MKYILLLLISVGLIGCSTTKKVEEIIVIKEVYRTTEIPAQYKTKCDVTKPLSNLEFSKLDPKTRENYLVNYIVQVMGDAKKCELKREGLVNYLNKHNKIIEDLNLKGAK